MNVDLDLLVFTDLDGTLIDHETYSWGPATQALDALKQLSAGVVLASSKTSAEMSPLRTELGLQAWPAIVENGAGILPAHTSEAVGDARYSELLAVLDNAPTELRSLFCGFGQASAAQVADMTGLSLKAAALAKKRAFSEPGQWLGDDAQKAAFTTWLKGHGVQAQQGGRFLTLSFGGNKVEQMREIIKTYAPQHTIALGDAPNDMQMLEHAEFGVVVHNPHRPPLPTLMQEAEGRVLRTEASGPTGWNTAILTLLHRLDLN